jgi:hypothetical protein
MDSSPRSAQSDSQGLRQRAEQLVHKIRAEHDRTVRYCVSGSIWLALGRANETLTMLERLRDLLH